RAAGRRENPRNVRPSEVDAAANTDGVHTLGNRNVVRHVPSEYAADRPRRLSRRSMSRISYAFDSCVITRHLNGEKNVGTATISTRQRWSEPCGAGAR